MTLSAREELDRWLDRSSRLFQESLKRLAHAQFEKTWDDRLKARKELAKLIQNTLILADLRGRRRVFMEMESLDRTRGRFAHGDLSDKSPLAEGVEFKEAVEDIVSRRPVLAKDLPFIEGKYNDAHVFYLAKAAEDRVSDRIAQLRTMLTKKALASVEKAGKGLRTFTELFQEIGPWSKWYADTVYHTNINNAYTNARFAQVADPVVQDVVPALELVGIADNRERENHRAGRGLLAAPDDPWWAYLRPPLGFNCFLPGTKVSGLIKSASKAFYSGPAIEIKTRNGCRLSVTVNHPILTSKGWLPAKSLSKGDYLFSDKRNINLFNSGNSRMASFVSSSGRAVDNQDMPALVQDIFDSISSGADGFESVFSGVSPLDFHGDAERFQGDIHVVRPNGHLLFGFTKQSELVEDFSLELSSGSWLPLNSFSMEDFFGNRSFSSASSLPSSCTLPLDNSSVVPTLFEETPFCLLRVGPHASLNAVASEKAKNSGVVDSKLISQLTGANAFEISFDQIVSIRRFPYSGHVYDFETETGWIVSNSIITSNCRHGVDLKTKFQLERMGRYKNGKVIPFYPPNIEQAHPDEGFNRGGL
jgi:hypothetical protein